MMKICKVYIARTHNIMGFYSSCDYCESDESKESMAEKLCDIVWYALVTDYMDNYYYSVHYNIVYNVKKPSFKAYCSFKNGIMYLKFVSKRESERNFPCNEDDILLIAEQFKKENIDIRSVCLDSDESSISVCIALKVVNFKKAPRLSDREYYNYLNNYDNGITRKNAIKTRKRTIDRIRSRHV